MRLHVSIKRYFLPTTNVIFTTRALGPSPATSSTDATIAQLLEDINDIVPLESADWGLEDYAVEVHGYECLHFSPIDAVLRDDDQIVIRALKTHDLRSRRLGGRHQISNDGRHLIDGVAFGRQWLKKGGRPAVQIPPRKRRLKIVGAQASDEQESGLLALTGVKDANDLDENDTEDEEDSDFVDEDRDALVSDESGGETGPDFVINTKPDLRIMASQDFDDADDESQDNFEDGNDEDLSNNKTSKKPTALSAELQALREEDESHDANLGGRRQESVQQPSPSDGGEIRSSRRKRKLPSDNDSEEYYGSEFNGFSSPIIKRVKAGKISAPSDSDSGSTSSSGSDSDEDSESGASLPPPMKQRSLDGSADSDTSSDSSETSSSDSEFDSDSDAASEDASSGSSSSKTPDVGNSNGEAPLKTPPESNRLVSVQKTSAPSAATSSATIRLHVPPGQGSKRTQYNNRRQKIRYRLRKLKELSVLPENATFIHMAAYDEAQQTGSLGPAAAVAKVMEVKKQELLGQVEEQAQEQEQEPVPAQAFEQDPSMGWETLDRSVHSPHSTNRRKENPLTDASSEQRQGPQTPLHERRAKDLIGSLLTPAVETKSEPPKRRARLDLDSTRNMIFSGLGVRKPKTAAAEQALRERLAKPVKGALPKQLFIDEMKKQDEGSARSSDLQQPWQSKLLVSAVECETSGVTLKDPPFPFVQGWDEDARRRLQILKKKGRNQRQYYAYDEDIGIDDDEEEAEAARDQADSRLYDDFNGGDTLDQLTTKVSNLTDEAHDQLDAKAGKVSIEDMEDLPRPHSIETLDALRQKDALPGALIAYKEFHLNATTFQPEISCYRIARIEAVGEDGSLDLTVSKGDRTPLRVAQYDKETGERILSRSEMFQGSDDTDEDDGTRLLAYADLIEPKILGLSTISKSVSSMSLKAKSEILEGPLHAASGSAVVAESTVSDIPSFTSAQPPMQTITTPVKEKEVDNEIETPRRTEISAMMKEAGFDSNLDSELLSPINGTAGIAQHSSPSLDITRESMNQSRKRSAEPVSEGQYTAPDTSGFDSPRFNGWSSSPPIEPEPDEATEETGLDELPTSSLSDEEHPREQKAGNETLAPRKEVTYPHISQLELDASAQESSGAQLRCGAGEDNPVHAHKQEDGRHVSDSGIKVVEDTHLDSLRSLVPPSVDESQEAEELLARNGHAPTTFLGGLDGAISSEDDELPSMARMTSTARSRSSRLSLPPLGRQGKRTASQGRKSTSPAYGESSASASQPPTKQSQSQVRLSQIPPGSQVVDLTVSSDPVSPGNSDGDYAETGRMPRSTNRGMSVTNGAKGDRTDALAVSAGLGNRRLLKSRKAKP